MALTVILVGLALFLLAFLGLKQLGHTLLGLVSMIGLFFGGYFIWLGFSGNSQRVFLWGCILFLAAGGFLIYLKAASGD